MADNETTPLESFPPHPVATCMHIDGTPEQRTALFKSLVAAQREIPAIGRDRANSMLKNKYVTLDNLREVIVPILNGHGIAVCQFSSATTDRHVMVAGGRDRAERRGVGGTVTSTTTIVHEQGGVAWFATSIPWQEAPGISSAQAVGIGATYCERYAFRSVFSVVATDDTDTDGESEPAQRWQPAPQHSAPTPITGSAPALDPADEKRLRDSKPADRVKLISELAAKYPPGTPARIRLSKIYNEELAA